MPRDEYLVEERQVGNCTVKVYYDVDPQHPDEGNDDLFLVCFSHHFHVARKGKWDGVGDFRDFLHPRFVVDGWDATQDLPEPTVEPQDGASDPEWRQVYLDNCTDQLEQVLLAAGQDSGFNNPAGRSAARENYDFRRDVWTAWRSFRAAHAEWACFTLDARYYGGGHINLSLGEIYDGSETDKWGDPVEPEGFVMVKRTVGWHVPVEQVAKSLVEEWQSYCDGDVYGYTVTDNIEDEEIDACWGYIGDKEYCMSEGVSAAEWHEKNGRKQLTLPFPEPQEAASG